MSTRGVRARHPDADPAGSSSAPARRNPGTASYQAARSSSALSPGSCRAPRPPAVASAIVPVTIRAPVSSGRRASAASTWKDRTDHCTARS